MTGHDFFSDAFVRSAAPHGAWVAEQLDTFNAWMPMGQWDVDLHRRIYRQSGREIGVGVIGSFSTGDNSWLWGWANPSWQDPAITAPARAVREIGERAGVPEFTRDLVDLSGFADPRMAAETLACAAMGVLGAAGYIGVTASATGRLYMVADDEQVPRARPDVITLPRVLMTGAGFLPVRHETVVAGYFAHHGIAHTRTPDGIEARLGDTDIVAVGFDDLGRISSVGVTAGPRTVPSAAFWRVAGPAMAQVLEQDEAFTAFLEANPYHGHDLAAGTLRCGDRDIRVRLLGIAGPPGTTWRWAGDTPARLAAVPGLAGTPETAPELDLSGHADPEALITLLSHGAAGLLGGGCCVDLPADGGGTAYLCVDDPSVPRPAGVPAITAAVRGAAAIAARLERPDATAELAAAYLARHGSVTRDGRTLRAVTASGALEVRVGDKGHADVTTV